MTGLAPTKVPGGRGELVLYLDYDGVMHHEDVWWHPRRGPYIKAPGCYTLFQHTQVLVDALEPYPNMKIVLSTSWVRHYTFSKAAKRLPPPLQQRVIGATFHTEMHEGNFVATPRGLQVWADVLRRQPRDWLAIDDDCLHWPAWCREKLVWTHDELGISEPRVLAELKTKLALMHAKGNTP
ncbi:HAD domain-containing protein [Variovorax sp. J22R24]|uniref:HAD domain-containing protein n=1 Tax=Variovorax gracilis TaxID=3053502 RepID=UPI002574986B|nr:HAD domain-containing protein [Variovorax sp. J22R24]MDM0108658.1 HAD domain-containing protein [Variovorax sp. J22R24]